MSTEKNYTVKLRSPSRELVEDIAELSVPTSYPDLVSIDQVAAPYVAAKNEASDEPKDWYALANCTDEPSV